MEYYRASHAGWRKPIEKVEVSRETDQSVFIIDSRGKERRNAKISGNERYFDSFDEAKTWLIECAKSDIIHANERVKRAEQTLIKYEALESQGQP